MSKALSMDLRTRVVAAIDQGMSCRQAAAHFGVSAASAIRWQALVRKQGHARPGPLGGERRSGRGEVLAESILQKVEQQPDITLAELCAAMAERGIQISSSSLWRFFKRRDITLKKRQRMRTSKVGLMF